MSDLNAKSARKEMYQVLRKANPLADSQVLKQLAYDLTQQAIKNLKEANV